MQRTYDELTIIKGVGIISKSYSYGLIYSKVVPAIPTGVTGAATGAAVVYLGATGVCYVTSSEAKEQLEVARSYAFSALDGTRERVEKIVRYVME